ncbi:PREDICTED: pirin-like protein [Populus euphratica]|uniref:Pirin-like protein n=1 Tax=Populus euphratica TaxID=75702 RepID=A0AAJ6SVY5_POPEU|nr:PREDICTED: pirin-like protein [Populus euphratica]
MRASFNRDFLKRLHPPTTTKASNSIHRIRNIMSESDQSIVFDTPRLVTKKILAKLQHEGDGAVVRRGIGRSDQKFLDPFLMLDDFSVSPPAGFPDHPHRGFETVTYMLQGSITHQDFAGHKGTIHTGDVQWMTAGRGIIHSEMPAGEGAQKGLQLWINLSSQDKMIEPRYQELLSDDIKRAEKDGAEVRIIAGESMGVRSPVYTRTPTMFLDFILKPEAQAHQNVPESWNGFVYVIEGEGVFGKPNSSPSTAHHVLVLGPGDGLSAWNISSKPLRFVLIAGQPINEPVVQYGPFVMNTEAEIDQTIEDYHYSKNGFEMAKHWRSQ